VPADKQHHLLEGQVQEDMAKRKVEDMEDVVEDVGVDGEAVYGY